MNRFRCAGLFILVTTVVVSAQTPANKEPHHRTVFENTHFRILDVNVPPGETTLEHSHNLDLVTVSMTEWRRYACAVARATVGRNSPAPGARARRDQ